MNLMYIRQNTGDSGAYVIYSISIIYNQKEYTVNESEHIEMKASYIDKKGTKGISLPKDVKKVAKITIKFQGNIDHKGKKHSLKKSFILPLEKIKWR